MTNEELQQEVKRLEEQITNLRIKILESKADKKPYEVEVPEDIENYYIIGYTGYTDSVKHFPEATLKRNYIRGLVFKTKEQAEQFDKERILLFKMHKWAEEHNGDWFPDWEDCDDKHYIYYSYDSERFCVGIDWNCDAFYKLPYFKTEEIAEQFIEEFGDEIKEVLC